MSLLPFPVLLPFSSPMPAQLPPLCIMMMIPPTSIVRVSPFRESNLFPRAWYLCSFYSFFFTFLLGRQCGRTVRGDDRFEVATGEPAGGRECGGSFVDRDEFDLVKW